MKILSIQISQPTDIVYNGRTVTTAINKAPVTGPLKLEFMNLAGDRQADLRVHGGRDKALYAYGMDALADWKAVRPLESFGPSAFGENLSLATLNESDVYVGDVFQVGGAKIQAVQPRFPCYKLAVKYGDPLILKQFMKVQRPGVYFRVLEEGLIDVGQSLELIDRETKILSVGDFFKIAHEDLPAERVQEILKVKALPPEWIEMFKERLE